MTDNVCCRFDRRGLPRFPDSARGAGGGEAGRGGGGGAFSPADLAAGALRQRQRDLLEDMMNARDSLRLGTRPAPNRPPQSPGATHAPASAATPAPDPAATPAPAPSTAAAPSTALAVAAAATAAATPFPSTPPALLRLSPVSTASSSTRAAGSMDAQKGRPEPLDAKDLVLGCECKICFGQVADTLLLPCAHLAICRWCADQIGAKSKSQSQSQPYSRYQDGGGGGGGGGSGSWDESYRLLHRYEQQQTRFGPLSHLQPQALCPVCRAGVVDRVWSPPPVCLSVVWC